MEATLGHIFRLGEKAVLGPLGVRFTHEVKSKAAELSGCSECSLVGIHWRDLRREGPGSRLQRRGETGGRVGGGLGSG